MRSSKAAHDPGGPLLTATDCVAPRVSSVGGGGGGGPRHVLVLRRQRPL